MQLILIACGILVMNYVLTFIQVRRYKKSMESLIGKYKGKQGYYLFSGQSRRKLGSGSIAMIVVDEHYTIKECQVMKGITVLSTFKEMSKYKGQHVGSLIGVLHEASKQEKTKRKQKVPAISAALNSAAESALLSISRKDMSSV